MGSNAGSVALRADPVQEKDGWLGLARGDVPDAGGAFVVADLAYQEKARRHGGHTDETHGQSTHVCSREDVRPLETA